MTIQDIEARPIVGNAYHDGPLMRLIHQFVVDDTNPIDERVRALVKLNEVMGIDEAVTTESVADYIGEITTLLGTAHLDDAE